MACFRSVPDAKRYAMSMADGKGLRNMSAFTRTQNSVMACVENALNAFILNSRGGSANGKSPQMACFPGRGHQSLRDAIIITTRREFYTPKGEPPSLEASCHWIGKTFGSPESAPQPRRNCQTRNTHLPVAIMPMASIVVAVIRTMTEVVVTIMMIIVMRACNHDGGCFGLRRYR